MSGALREVETRTVGDVVWRILDPTFDGEPRSARALVPHGKQGNVEVFADADGFFSVTPHEGRGRVHTGRVNREPNLTRAMLHALRVLRSLNP